jgi:hypothetical protein
MGNSRSPFIKRFRLVYRCHYWFLPSNDWGPNSNLQLYANPLRRCDRLRGLGDVAVDSKLQGIRLGKD